MIRQLLRDLSDSPLGTRVRAWSGIRSPQIVRPWNAGDTVSDLFMWRSDTEWQTVFLLSNIPTLIDPASKIADRVFLEVYDVAGHRIAKQDIVLAPGETKQIEVGSLIGDRAQGGCGTFCVFHHPERSPGLFEEKSMNISERGYVGYRRSGDEIWAMVHGNANAFAMGAAEPYSISVVTSGTQIYRLQVRLDDCIKFQLACSNPSQKPQTLTAQYHDDEGALVGTCDAVVPARGVHLFDSSAISKRACLVELFSNVMVWRPLVFKFYSGHFDVFHG